jgi:16S rRNA (uracil1498-N3)-methyltransferase
MIIATGPEGGWTEKEVESAINAGFQPVSLGRRILRAVTAPIVALSIVAAQLESLDVKNVS